MVAYRDEQCKTALTGAEHALRLSPNRTWCAHDARSAKSGVERSRTAVGRAIGMSIRSRQLVGVLRESSQASMGREQVAVGTARIHTQPAEAASGGPAADSGTVI